MKRSSKKSLFLCEGIIYSVYILSFSKKVPTRLELGSGLGLAFLVFTVRYILIAMSKMYPGSYT